MLVRVPEQTEEDLRAWASQAQADAAHATTRLFRRRVEEARKAVREFAARGPCYAGVSWGKDSVVLAHLVATEAPDVPLVWLRVEPIKNPHCALVRDLFLRAHAGARYDEIETWCRRDAQGWHATGTLEAGIKEAERRYGAAHLSGVRGQESGARALRMQRWGTTTARTCGPIGWWTGLDVFAYLALHDLPIHPAYAMNVGGCLTGSGSASRPSAASGARGMAGRSGRRGTTAVRWRRWTVN